MSVKAVLLPPFCENGCVYLCDICAHNMAASAAAANDDDEENGVMFNMYPTVDTNVTHKVVIPRFTEIKPKIIKIREVIVVEPLDKPEPLKLKEGEIVTYDN